MTTYTEHSCLITNEHSHLLTVPVVPVRVLPEFPLLVPFIVLLPLSVSVLANQAPMISIKGGTGTVFILSLISEDNTVPGKSLYLS